MKNLMILLGVVLIIFACSSKKGIVKVSQLNKTTVKESLEYELETFDLSFETWYELQNSPAKYRSQGYYESWNKQYVTAWNYKASTLRNAFFEPIIGYSSTTDYGFEINHELFYYFMYVENVLKTQILSNGPKSIVF